MNEQTPGARIIRRFSRLGIGAAVLVVSLCALVMAFEILNANDPPTVDEVLRVGGTIVLLALAGFGFFFGLGWILAVFARD